jgi:hypothetical protein
MALSLFIQEGVVSTGIKKGTSIAQLFDVTNWLKIALTQLGVTFYDNCATCKTPSYGSTLGSWTTATRPTVAAGVVVVGFNTTTSKLEVYTGTAWVVLANAMV